MGQKGDVHFSRKETAKTLPTVCQVHACRAWQSLVSLSPEHLVFPASLGLEREECVDTGATILRRPASLENLGPREGLGIKQHRKTVQNAASDTGSPCIPLVELPATHAILEPITGRDVARHC